METSNILNTTTPQRTTMLTLLSDELVSFYIFPFLSGNIRDLRALDTAYTNKRLHSSIWALCSITSSHVKWLLHAGVRIISMRVSELSNMSSIIIYWAHAEEWKKAIMLELDEIKRYKIWKLLVWMVLGMVWRLPRKLWFYAYYGTLSAKICRLRETQYILKHASQKSVWPLKREQF